MPDAATYQTIKNQTCALIESITLNPKPSYNIDGQMVSWSDYLKQLRETLDWVDKKLVEEGSVPSEIFSEGFSG